MLCGKGASYYMRKVLAFFMGKSGIRYSLDRANAQLSVFSSPEHNVLRGSYCDRSSSGVRPSICPSVNNFFELLLQNQKANLDKTWQECSLGEALQKLLKEFNSNKNSHCHGNKMAENGKNL